MVASTADTASNSFPPAGTTRATPTPTAEPAAPATSPATVARPTPAIAAGPRNRRVASTIGTATASRATEEATVRAGTTRRGGASATSGNDSAACSNGPA